MAIDTSKIKCPRGRPRLRWIDGVKSDISPLRHTLEVCLNSARDKKLWLDFIDKIGVKNGMYLSCARTCIIIILLWFFRMLFFLLQSIFMMKQLTDAWNPLFGRHATCIIIIIIIARKKLEAYPISKEKVTAPTQSTQSSKPIPLPNVFVPFSSWVNRGNNGKISNTATYRTKA